VRRLTGVVVAVGVLAALVGCGREEESDAVARVDGAVLTVDDFYESIPEQLLAVMSLEDQEEALKAWVKTELFYQEALRRGVGDDEALRRRLTEIEREFVAEKHIKQLMDDVPEVTEQEARAYFESRKSDYAIQVRLAHILVRSRAEADRALARIRSGTPFETVAETVSIDQTGPLGGDLGYMRRGEMIHELEEAAFELKVGEVSGVRPSSYGYHIIKVLDRHPGAGQPSFEAKRSAVMNFLTSQRRRRAFDERLRELEGRATVVVDTARLRLAARDRIQSEAPGGFPDESAAQSDSAGVEMP